jgi:hypothetical protein
MLLKNIQITLLISIILFLTIQAQDRHFWDQAVGGKTALLGGVAIGGVRDYSATFYNPGALGFISKNKLSFSFNMYGIKSFTFIDGAGPGIDPNYTRVSLFPASLAGSLPFFGDSLSRFSYMIYGNGYSYVRVSERYEGYADVIPTRPPAQPGFPNSFEGEELLINQGKLDALLQEVTVGFGYGRMISDNVGVGVTLLGAYRDQTKVRYESYAALDTTIQRAATSEIFVDIDYWAVRLSLKFGISIEWDDLKLGATFTTPSFPIKKASGGTDHASLISNNVLVIVDSSTNQVLPIDILASDRQEGLPVNYISPYYIGAGIEYKFSDKTIAHLSAEWFGPLSTYVVLQPESHDFIRNTVGVFPVYDSAELLRVYDAMKTTLNVGIALEQKLTDKFTGYAAVRTDFSNANFPEIDGLRVGFTDWDIYHFTLGASTELNNTFIGVGFEYSHGQRSDFIQIFNFPTGVVEPGDVAIYSERGTSKVLYNNFNIFFGVTQLL